MRRNEDQLFQLLVRNLRKKNNEKIALRKLGVAIPQGEEGAADHISSEDDGDHRGE